MKKIKAVLLGALFTALLMTGCKNGLLEPGSLDDFTIEVNKITLSANELATIEGYELDLTASKFPLNGNQMDTVWESSAPAIADVDQNGHITTVASVGGVPKTAIIKVYSVADPSIYAVCPVTVYPDYGSDRHWDFGKSITVGSTTVDLTSSGPYTSLTSDQALPLGMTLNGATGSGTYTEAPATPDGYIPTLMTEGQKWAHPYPWVYSINPDDPYAAGLSPTGSTRSGMALNNADGIPSGSGWSNGALRTNGVGRILSIAALKGPFYIEVRYTTNTIDSARWAEIRIGDKAGTRIQGYPSLQQTAAGGGGIAAYTYTGTDVVPFVYIEAQASIRIHEVIIEDMSGISPANYKKPYIPVSSTFAITGDASMAVGETKTYKTGIQPGLTAPVVFAWSVTGDGTIVGPADGPTVQVKGTANGTVTLSASVTTTDPNTGGTATTGTSSALSVAINAYTPITNVAITGVASVAENATIQLTAAPTPANATNPVYAWTITAGTGNGQITAGAATGQVTVKGLTQGQTFTVKVTATTTDPANPSSTVTKEATQVVTVTAPSGGGGTDKTWNFSVAPFGSAVSYSAETTVDDLTILPASSGTAVQITTNNKSIDGFSFTQRMQLNGTGSVTERALKFNVTAACTIKVYYMSGSGGTTRTLIVSDGANPISTDASFTNDGNAIAKGELSYTGGTGSLYLYSSNGGINVYGIVVDYP